MKSIIIATLVAAATVSAQISALPACAITCGAQAAVATPCKDPSDINCTCQASNQAIIYPLLSACLASTCTNPSDIPAAIAAGKGICATVAQTGTPSNGTVAPTMASNATMTTMKPTVAPYTGGAAELVGGVGKVVLLAAGAAALAL